MDAVDEAQAQTDLAIKLALKNLPRAPELIPTGSCYYCDASVVDGAFCDADCRDDYEKK